MNSMLPANLEILDLFPAQIFALCVLCCDLPPRVELNYCIHYYSFAARSTGMHAVQIPDSSLEAGSNIVSFGFHI